MQQQLIKLSIAIGALFFAAISSAQNVGIGTSTPLQKLHVQGNSYTSDSVCVGIAVPKAILDVQGTTLLRGGNTNTFTIAVSAGVEFFTGRNSAGGVLTGQTNPDIAFNFGGPGGGYKHFITTHHNSQGFSAGNAINFYVNNSFNPAQSSSPGNGNFLQFAVTASGVGVGKGIPTAMLDVQGDAKISGKAVFNDSLIAIRGVRFENNTRVNGNITVTGDVEIGYITQTVTSTVMANTVRLPLIECPPGTRLIGGGGGVDYSYHQQIAEVKDIRIYYNGPSVYSPETRWTMVVENTSTNETRQVVLFCKCARIN